MTPNCNESFDRTVYDRIPKSVYCSTDTFHFGIYDAAAHFNIGAKANILLFEKLGMIPGKYTLLGCSNLNKKRLYHSDYKTKEPNKKRRKILRGTKKSKDNKLEQNEGTLYEAGAF